MISENGKYESSEHYREILQLLAKGERELQAGEGYDLDSILAEADALLEESLQPVILKAPQPI